MSYTESVWELPESDLNSPEAALATVKRLWEQGDDAKCVAFDIADGLHWHCSLWHGGQWSDRYRIMCELEYSPGACQGSPDEDESEEREAARYVFDLLEASAKGEG